jgi:FlaA1/EpsC-like NDP-sugar epimerase
MNQAFLSLPRFHKQLIAAAVDFVFLPLIFFFSLLLHLDGAPGPASAYLWVAFTAAIVAIPVFIKLGMYRAVIRYIDQEIVIAAFRCATLAAMILGAIYYVLPGAKLSAPPFLIYWIASILYMLASRFIARSLLNSRRGLNTPVRVAIYGAGEAGSMLARAILPGLEYRAVLFVDDSAQRINTTIGGIRVYPAKDLEQLTKKYDIDTVLLAMPAITPLQQRKILDNLASLSLIIKVTPPISSIVEGTARVEDVRKIEIEDLLSRAVVAPNHDLLSVCVAGRSVMVSGAGGSIGSELCRQILALQPSRLLLLDISEFALYRIEQELRALIAARDSDIELIPCIGSVTETEKCTRLMTAFGVETVYHAAAYKHVPLVEHNPIEGIRNNAFGTLSLADAAMRAKVRNFVLVSTDKAVRPTNVMGATKRLAELILQAFARRDSQTKFCMVRFGNVLGSSGSVVPLFRKQIAAGGPLTLTHPDITRYFMTIPEAAQLVIQAGAMGEGGDVFVLDMGKPVRIEDLAVRMVHLSGKEVKTTATPDGDIEIRYVGLRPGEKLYEELLIGSNVSTTVHPLILRAKESEFEWPVLKHMLQHLDDACTRFDHNAVRLHLQKIVREYAPSTDIADNVWKQGSQETIIKLLGRGHFDVTQAIPSEVSA